MTQKNLDVASEIVRTINSVPISEKSVIVYDIDGTLIDLNGVPILPIIRTYQHAKNVGLTPVIITARPGTNKNIQWTIDQLRISGVTDYKYMYFLPEDKRDQANFKLISRKHLHEIGYQVVISIGDMPWDIGQYGGIGFKIN